MVPTAAEKISREALSRVGEILNCAWKQPDVLVARPIDNAGVETVPLRGLAMIVSSFGKTFCGEITVTADLINGRVVFAGWSNPRGKGEFKVGEKPIFTTYDAEDICAWILGQLKTRPITGKSHEIN